jgi:hypothetical protein
MVKNIFKKREMRYKSYLKSERNEGSAMEELMENPKIARVLDKKSEQREFYGTLSKYAEGGITKKEMRETLGELYMKDKTLSHKEVKELGSAIAKEYNLGKHRIEVPKEEAKDQAANQKASAQSSKSFDVAAGVQGAVLEKGLSDMANSTSAVHNEESGKNNVVPFSRYKKPSEKASGLINDILNKKAA